MPQISVIVPVYKVEPYLRRCVDSILAQTFTDFELILVDDGSPDNCGAICDEYAAKDARIKVFHQSNRGQAAARNTGIWQSAGEWICFVDSDDLIHPQLLQTLYDSVCRYQVQITSCLYLEETEIPESFFAARNPQFSVLSINESTLAALMEKGHYWVVWGKLIHRSIVENLPFEEGRVYEDNAIVCQWLYQAGQIAITSEALYFYFINPTGTTKAGFTLKQLDYIWAIRQQELLYLKVGYMSLAERKARSQVELYLNNCARVDNELGDKEAVKRLKIEFLQFLLEHHALKLSKNTYKRIVYLYIPPVARLAQTIKCVLRRRNIDDP